MGRYNSDFCVLVTNRMRKKGIKGGLTTLSKQLGFKPSTLSHFFAGETKLTEKEIYKITDYLGIPEHFIGIFLEKEVEIKFSIRKEVGKDE